MLSTQRATASARQLLRRQPRRFDSHAADSHAAQHPSGPVNESLGRGFYLTLAALPLSFALFKFSTSEPSSTPYLTRIIESFSTLETKWANRNAIHTAAAEQAAHDRHLFQSERPRVTIDLRFPEAFNSGSPWNVQAGQGGADLSTLIKHYEERNRRVEESRVRRMKDGKVVSVYD